MSKSSRNHPEVIPNSSPYFRRCLYLLPPLEGQTRRRPCYQPSTIRGLPLCDFHWRVVERRLKHRIEDGIS
jgi:hypothetical protein